MYVYIYMYGYVCVFVCVCIVHVIYSCIHYVHACMGVVGMYCVVTHTHICICARAHVRMYEFAYIYVYIYVCVGECMVMHLRVLVESMQVCLCVRAWGKRPARARRLDVYHHVQSYVCVGS